MTFRFLSCLFSPNPNRSRECGDLEGTKGRSTTFIHGHKLIKKIHNFSASVHAPIFHLRYYTCEAQPCSKRALLWFQWAGGIWKRPDVSEILTKYISREQLTNLGMKSSILTSIKIQKIKDDWNKWIGLDFQHKNLKQSMMYRWTSKARDGEEHLAIFEFLKGFMLPV